MLVARSIVLFVLAALAEIGGAWLVWQGVRNDKPWYYILAGASQGVGMVCQSERRGQYCWGSR